MRPEENKDNRLVLHLLRTPYPLRQCAIHPMYATVKLARPASWGTSPTMDAVAGASVSSSSARLRPCPRPRRIGNVAPATVRRRSRRRAVTCAAAADADVVGLFDAAKLTVRGFSTVPSARWRLDHVYIILTSSVAGLASGGQVCGERHGGRARLRPGVRPRHPVPRHSPPARVSHWHPWNTLVSSGCWS